MNERLPTEVYPSRQQSFPSLCQREKRKNELTLNRRQAAFERHDQRALEHVLCPPEFLPGDSAADGTAELVQLLADRACYTRCEVRVDGCGYTEQTRVGVTVVEAGAKVDGVVSVQDVGVEAGVHPFTRSA